MSLKLNNSKFCKIFGFALFLFLTIKINAQQSIDTIVKYDDVITFQPPSKNFIPLVFQTHNKLLRFGQQNDYYLSPDGSFITHHTQPNLSKKIEKKNTQLLYSRQAIYELLKLKFMTQIYTDIDKTMFTKHENEMYTKDKNSHLAQTHLLKLANTITSVKKMNHYFCNPKEEDCQFNPKSYYYRDSRRGKNWGGKLASEFEQLRNYSAYVKENLVSLQQWSTTIFPDNTIDGYFVTKVYLGEYDFKNNGYWLDSSFFSYDFFLLQYQNLEPRNTNERKLIHSNGSSILFKMSPAEAEKLSEKIKNIYMAFKIKVMLKGVSQNYDNLNASYTLESPIITLYKDDDLTLKIGEISTDTMLTK